MNIYKINDCDWWMAETLEQAVADYRKLTGEDDPEYYAEARQLTDEELDRIKFSDTESVEAQAAGGEIVRSFREQMAIEVAAGHSSTLFATTEY